MSRSPLGLPDPDRFAAQLAKLPEAPDPRGRPVTVSREVPVTLLQTGDGGRHVVNHETDEPCYACPCCALWARSLDTLAGAIRAHAEQEHVVVSPPLQPDCLVCQVLVGAFGG